MRPGNTRLFETRINYLACRFQLLNDPRQGSRLALLARNLVTVAALLQLVATVLALGVEDIQQVLALGAAANA